MRTLEKNIVKIILLKRLYCNAFLLDSLYPFLKKNLIQFILLLFDSFCKYSILFSFPKI